MNFISDIEIFEAVYVYWFLNKVNECFEKNL